MLKTRILTAIALGGGFIGILFFFPANLFSAFIVAAVLLASWEWANLAGFEKSLQRLLYLLSIATLFAVLATKTIAPVSITAESGGNLDDSWLSAGWSLAESSVKQILFIACAWWALALLWVQSYPGSALLWGSRILRALMGVLVLIPTAVSLIYLRSQPAGAWLILLVVAVVVCADVGAYFSGRAFGRHKLAPAVSPGKSWEGFWGGVLSCVLLALIVGYCLGDGRWLLLLALIIPTGLASVLGDLLESMVKRHRGLKDSGQILPGHGGILDRVDSLTAAAPVFAMALILSNWKI